jgi:hypothetical protein
MIGILLAGGAATRLPNKPLLPMKDLRPVCFSGMDYLIRHRVPKVVVVTPPNSVIVDVIHSYYSDKVGLEFVYQPEARGVGDALNACELEDRDDGDHAMVVMADNVYPDETISGLVLDEWPFVVVRDVPAWRAPHLVKAEPKRDLRRKAAGGNLVLSTPWVIHASNFSTLEGWPDLSGTKRQVESGKDWWDVGTPATYEAYWRST